MDVKSKNILLDKEYNVAKIADVGLARVLGNTVSTRGLPLGTFHYAAPELLVGDRNLVTEKVHSSAVNLSLACLQHCLSRSKEHGTKAKYLAKTCRLSVCNNILL